MTIDESIAHARKVANEKYTEGMLCHANPNDEELDGCIECAREHEQLAEWLEELKSYRTLDKTNFSDGYNRGIDDFKEAVKTAVTEMDDISAYVNPTERICEILKIESERLKAGDDNDR